MATTPDRSVDPDVPPGLAVRRHQDRCFHAVEEVVEGEGYIVEGILIPLDEVAEVRRDAPRRGNVCRPAG